MWWWLWMGCVAGPGFAEGVLEVEDVDGEYVPLIFDAGALVWSRKGRVGFATSTVKRGFTCDYVRTDIEAMAGDDIDRRRDHEDLVWWADEPTRALVFWSEEHVLGGGSLFHSNTLEAEMVLDVDGTSGELVTEAGTVTFDAEDCGAL